MFSLSLLILCLIIVSSSCYLEVPDSPIFALASWSFIKDHQTSRWLYMFNDTFSSLDDRGCRVNLSKFVFFLIKITLFYLKNLDLAEFKPCLAR